MSESIDRREGLRRGVLGALALSLGIPGDALAEGAEADRFQLKFYAGERLLGSVSPDATVERAIASRPTGVRALWFDMEQNPRRPLSQLGFTESFQLKNEW